VSVAAAPVEPAAVPAAAVPAAAVPPAVVTAAEVDALVREHLPLVGHLVRTVLVRVPAHVNQDDLVSAGMLALVLAARSFDPGRGVPFTGFAAIRIRGALTDALRSMDWASRAVRSKARQVDAVRAELAAALGRTPSREQIAQAMGVAVGELDAVEADVDRAAVVSLQSLNPDGLDERLPLGGDGPEAVLLRREQIGYLHDAVAELPERLRLVVQRYFFENRKMAEIADELGVTESRISQLRSEALVLMRAAMAAMTADTADLDTPTPQPAAPARQRAYTAAVINRSTLTTRLHTTTLLGEPRPLAAVAV
jgi:RNA polymerase sigma factor for flagellar operon FliA